MTGTDDDRRATAMNHDILLVNGHEFATIQKSDDDRLVECTECLIQERVEDDDPEPQLEELTDQCKIEWLLKPQHGVHRVGLRNTSMRGKRELIQVHDDAWEVTDTVPIFDDDAPKLARLLRGPWED